MHTISHKRVNKSTLQMWKNGKEEKITDPSVLNRGNTTLKYKDHMHYHCGWANRWPWSNLTPVLYLSVQCRVYIYVKTLDLPAQIAVVWLYT